MKCQKCGKHDAVMHISETINGIKNETYLCKYCSEDYQQSSHFHSIFKNNIDSFFDDFWKSPIMLNQSRPTPYTVCPNCKTTLSELQSRGRLGCSECYNTFRDYLAKAFKNIHGSSAYIGKQPHEANPKNELKQLKFELSKAIDTQNFEQAAKLRDKIREMEA